MISETGWPSGGNSVGAAVPSAANAGLYANQFLSWANANTIPSFYFEAFDEAFKANYEGPQGATFGLWTSAGALKSGITYFGGTNTTTSCVLPGSPGLNVVYVPPAQTPPASGHTTSSADSLEIQATGVVASNYAVAAYIKVNGVWYNKPYYPGVQTGATVPLNSDGTAKINITTGGAGDYAATDIAVFLVQSGYVPPTAAGTSGSLPSVTSTGSTVVVGRTASSVSGTIADAQGNPISGATVFDSRLGTTTSAPDGKYSFYNVGLTGGVSPQALYPGYVFSPASAALTLLAANQEADFTGTSVNLSIGSTLEATQTTTTGSPVTLTLVAANAGVSLASDAKVTITIPASFAVSAATTSGSCVTNFTPMTCDLGSLAGKSQATITLTLTPSVPGQFTVSAAISGPDPDPNTGDKNTSQTLTVMASQTITFGPLGNVLPTVSPFTVSATASSGLAVTFSSTTTSVCTVSGNTVTIQGAGICSITANQAGNASYLAASPVTESFSVVSPTGTATCSSASANAVFLRHEGTAEQVADVTLSCTGGNGQPMNITVYLSPSVNITSGAVGSVSEAIAGLNATASTLAAGTVNGVVSGGSVAFTGVPTAIGTFTVTITNIRVNASSFTISNGVPQAVSETLFVAGAGVTPGVVNPVTVGYAMNGLGAVSATGAASLPVCSSIVTANPAFSVQFAEAYVNAFKTQGSSATNSGLGSWVTNNTETGYGISSSGLNNTATSGTRVKIVFTNIPTGVIAYVPVSISFNGGVMSLTASETGAFAAVPASTAASAPANTAALAVVSGSATAVYEQTTSAGVSMLVNGVVTSAPATYTVPVYLSAAAGAVSLPANAITATVSLAPIGAAAGTIPNFVSTSSTATVTGSAFTGCGQTITFPQPSNIAFGSGTVTLNATASSGLAVTYSSNSTNICTVSGNIVTPVGGGSCSITASQTGNQYYAAAPSVTQTLNISSAPQTITFAALGDVPLSGRAAALIATASSGLAVTFTSNTPSVCTVNSTSSSVLPVAAGKCAVTASQAGNAGYAAATPVTQSFNVTAASTQTIQFDAIPNQIFGGSPFVVAAQASSGLPLAIVSATPAVCKTASNIVTLSGAGTCSITASQSGNANYTAAASVTRVFNVNQAKPSGTLITTAASPIAVGTNPFYMAVADFNGDGIQDLAVANNGDNNVTVLLGDGAGGFTGATGSPFAVGANPTAIAAGDFNGDGIPDLATANGDGTVTVLLGNGAGGFAAGSGSPYSAGPSPRSMTIGDFNGDGIQDLAVANSFGNNVTLLLGNGAGGFTPAAGSPFAVGFAPVSTAAGDFNGDGLQDLAVANFVDGTVTVLLGNGAGGFTTATGGPFRVGAGPESVVIGDFNGDGVPDLATANRTDSTVTVLLGNGSGGFTAATGSPFTVGEFPESLIVYWFSVKMRGRSGRRGDTALRAGIFKA